MSTTPAIEWKEVDVGGSVATDFANRAARNGRSQFRIRHGNILRDNEAAATVWTTGEGANKPTLTIVIEQP